jgi:hypothetical protein
MIRDHKCGKTTHSTIQTFAFLWIGCLAQKIMADLFIFANHPCCKGTGMQRLLNYFPPGFDDVFMCMLFLCWEFMAFFLTAQMSMRLDYELFMALLLLADTWHIGVACFFCGCMHDVCPRTLHFSLPCLLSNIKTRTWCPKNAQA